MFFGALIGLLLYPPLLVLNVLYSSNEESKPWMHKALLFGNTVAVGIFLKGAVRFGLLRADFDFEWIGSLVALVLGAYLGYWSTKRKKLWIPIACLMVGLLIEIGLIVFVYQLGKNWHS